MTNVSTTVDPKLTRVGGSIYPITPNPSCSDDNLAFCNKAHHQLYIVPLELYRIVQNSSASGSQPWDDQSAMSHSVPGRTFLASDTSAAIKGYH